MLVKTQISVKFEHRFHFIFDIKKIKQKIERDHEAKRALGWSSVSAQLKKLKSCIRNTAHRYF